MATYAVTDSQLTAIADAIRLKRDIATDIEINDMPLQIGLIEGGGSGGYYEGSYYNSANEAQYMSIDISSIPFDPDIVLVKFDDSQPYTLSAPTKAWALCNFVDISDIFSYGTILGVTYNNNIAVSARGESGTNTIGFVAVTTNRIDWSNKSVQVYSYANAYRIMAGTYKIYAYKLSR